MMYFAALLISSCLGYAYACSCIQLSDADKCCQAEFGVLVKTKDNGTIDGDYKKFRVKLAEVYKSEVGKRKMDKKFLYTATDSARCGVNLKEDTFYIVTGDYIDVKNEKGKKMKGMKIHSCGYMKEVTHPTCTIAKENLVKHL